MLATPIIVFREIIEAGLIIGIVLAATRGVPNRSRWIGLGVLSGLIGACVVAAFTGTISTSLEGLGHEWFNIAILTIAVLMLTWHNVWMARHGRDIAIHMKSVGEAVARGQRSLIALSVVIGITVLREGSEVVLFLFGITISGDETAGMLVLGGLFGMILGGLLAVLMYLGLLRIPTRYVFAVTSTLIALLAAGMAAQAATLMQQADIITALTQTVWDSSQFLSNSSITGQVLHTLIGYTERPTQLQVMVYTVTLVIIFVLMRLFGHAPAPQKTAAPSPQMTRS